MRRFAERGQLLRLVNLPYSKRSAIDGQAICLELSNGPDGAFVKPHYNTEKRVLEIIHSLLFVDIQYTRLQNNHNPTRMARDTDKNNAGASWLVLLGLFKNGQFYYTNESGEEKTFDASGSVQKFDARLLHGAHPHEGERYSLVIFRHSAADEADHEGSPNQHMLEALGLPVHEF